MSQAPMNPPVPPQNAASASYAALYAPQEGKGKKKKKGKALWIFLIIVLLIVGVILLIRWSNKKATDLLSSNLTPYSFGYSGYDYHEYVTQDIYVPTEIYLANGKAVPIKWSSKNDEVLDAQGKVQRPESENQEVTLTAAIRYGLGKGEADFSFNVIKTDHVHRSEVYVLTKEEVASGEAAHHLFVGFEDEDEENIFSVYGNFGQTKVTSMEDALYVMELYRPLFNLDESHQFVAEDVMPGNGTKTYKLRQVCNGIPYWNNSVSMTVKEDGKLEAINLHVCRDTQVNCDFSMTEEELTAIAAAELGEEAVIAVPEKGIYVDTNGCPSPAYRFYAVSMDAFENEKTLKAYKLEVDAETKEILSKSSTINTLLDTQVAQAIVDAAETETASSKTEGASEEADLICWAKLLNGLCATETVQAEDVFGNEREFIVSRIDMPITDLYYMHDPFRRISVAHADMDEFYKMIVRSNFDGNQVLSQIMALEQMHIFLSNNSFTPEDFVAYIQNTINAIKLGQNGTEVILGAFKANFMPMLYVKNFENQRAVSSYVNLRDTYDWYLEHLNRNSLDGKGQLIACAVDMKSVKDNAAFFPIGEYFIAAPEDTLFTYPPCGALDTMAHEYTHGVFYHVVGDLSDGGYMSEAINEGYADIFGCLVEGNWKMGETVADKVMRDPTGTETELLCDYKYPTRYFGEHWSLSDGHIDGILLSRAAYQMTQSGFTEEDVANIWYKSMEYGYDTRSDFLSVRYNVIQAARNLGYTVEETDVIEDIFGLMGIGTTATRELRNAAIRGHELMDDFTDEKFLMPMTPLLAVLGDMPVYIYHLDNGEPVEYTDEEISEMMSAALSYKLAAIVNEIPFYFTEEEITQILSELTAYAADDVPPSDFTNQKIYEMFSAWESYQLTDTNIHEYNPDIPIEKKITVKYERVSKAKFDMYEAMLSKDLITKYSEIILDHVGTEAGDAKEYLELADSEFMRYVWDPSVHECPPYIFWTDCVGVDFYILAKMGYFTESEE